MNKLFSISKYEYKMQIKRIAGWILLLAVFISSMIDCLPTAANMARIEFLSDIHYYVRRVFSFDGLILLFGMMFLMAGRLVNDRKTGCRDLYMAAPIGKGSYISGKLLGNFLYALTLMYALLFAALVGFVLFHQTEISVMDYISAVFEVSIYIILPASFFVVASSVMLPEIIDIRLFYLVYSSLFLVNAFSSDTGATEPCYIFTHGDLAKMIWQHPKSPVINIGSAALNLLFMLGVGIVAIVLVSTKRKFWRAN